MPEFRLLGPPGARGPAGEAQLGRGLTLRIVLAILVLRAGQLVSRDTLVDALWPDDPPPGARQTVESYVSRLRRALREAGLDAAVIESAPAGYRLVLNGYAVDRDRFEALVSAARAARSPAIAAARLDEALALWTGQALDGLADRPALSAHAAALTQARLLALEAWAEAQLEVGHVAEVVAALQLETRRPPAPRAPPRAPDAGALPRGLPGGGAGALRGRATRARRRAGPRAGTGAPRDAGAHPAPGPDARPRGAGGFRPHHRSPPPRVREDARRSSPPRRW